jgi:hypothetical protein
MKTSKLQAFFSKHWKAIGGAFLILLMVASTFGVVIDYLSTDNTNSTSGKGTWVGSYNSINVYKLADTDYYANLGSVEWHFRANPLEGANVTLESKYKLVLSTLMAGPGARDLLTGKTFNKVIFLVDPLENSRVGLDVLELSKTLGNRGWGMENIEAAYTSPYEPKPDAKIMTLSQAQILNESAFVFYLGVLPSLPDNSSIKAYYSPDSKGVSFFVMGKDYAGLDRAQTAISMFLLGWIQ